METLKKLKFLNEKPGPYPKDVLREKPLRTVRFVLNPKEV
jgi:hypothetical protein